MGQRLDLQTKLEEILGSSNVYFQPPNGTEMKYPAIVYHRDFGDTAFAANYPYRIEKRYQITVMDKNPDSAIPDKIAKMQTSVFNRFYTADNLNHFVYLVFF